MNHIKYSYEYYRYIMVVNRNLTKSKFLDLCGADSGYANQLFAHLYDCIFCEAKDAQVLFDKYYYMEYDTYEDFLLKRYGMTKFMHNEFISLLHSCPDYKVIEFSSLDYGDGGMEDFLFSEQLRERIYNILLMK